MNPKELMGQAAQLSEKICQENFLTHAELKQIKLKLLEIWQLIAQKQKFDSQN